MIVFLLLLMSAASFFILVILSHMLDHDAAFNAIEIFSIIIFSILWLLAVWSLIVMVKSGPGYIPYNYKYDKEKMSERDRLIYEHLNAALHTTANQLREMHEKDGYIRGTFDTS